jgi:NAD(P)H-hydrate repair Nnr-like enzyme with NAD(P)H-hydrate dehydratase domain
MTPPDAAQLAVVVHALSGRRVVDTHGWRSLIASDLLDEIPAALEALYAQAHRATGQRSTL